MMSGAELSSVIPDMTSVAVDNVSYENVTRLTFDLDIPTEMTFGSTNVMSVVVYTVLFVVAATGNMAVFCTLFKNRHRRSRLVYTKKYCLFLIS